MNFDYLPKLDGRYGTEPVFYSLTYRVVRIRISEELTETLVTNLPQEQYPPKKLKELYALRWGIETSFRSLKYTVGMLQKKRNAYPRKYLLHLSYITLLNGSLPRWSFRKAIVNIHTK